MDEISSDPAPAERKSPPADLAAVTRALLDVIQRRPDYFEAMDPTSPQESIATRVLRQLHEAQQALEGGDLTAAHHATVKLFSGQQSRDIDAGREHDNNLLIEDLYNCLNQVAGRGPKSYHDIKHDAVAAAAANLYMRADSPFKGHIEAPVVALSSSRDELYGVQLRIAPKLHATFTVENIADEDRPHQGDVYLTVSG